MLGSSFFQREPLTKRIYNILKQYPDGLALPKEFVQNADDAGAERVHIVWDKRSHPSDNLLDANLVEYQGPSLMIYNDAKFTADDFRNICQLGGETKAESETRIGKFGLGFNVVYNVTDIPMFVSADRFCVFDPHCQSLLDGGRVVNLNDKFLDNHIVDLMSDQLKPFECFEGFNTSLFKNNSSNEFLGTIFRLPLRSNSQAENSKLSKLSYDENEIMCLFDMMRKMGELLILFTQNVHEIKVSILENEGEDFECLFSFSRSISNITNLLSNANLSSIRILSESTECTYEVDITESSNHVKKYLISAYSRKRHLEGIMASCAAVSICDGIPNILKTNTLCCFLPLPIHSKLPFILNGNFELSTSRRELTMKTIDDKRNTGQWNNELLRDYSVPAIFNLLNLVKSYLQEPEDVYSLFPVELDYISEHIVESFYKLLLTSNVPLFSTITGFQCLSNIKIIDEDIDFKMQIKIKSLLDVLYNNKFISNATVVLPSKIFKMFYKYSFPSDLFLSLANCLRIILQNVKNLNYKEAEEVVFYAQLQSQSEINQILKTQFWIKTKAKYLDACHVVHPHSEIASLLYFTDAFFPCEESGFWRDVSEISRWDSMGLVTAHLSSDMLRLCWENMLSIDNYQEAVGGVKELLLHLNNFYQYYGEQDLCLIRLPVIFRKKFQWFPINECYTDIFSDAIDLAFPVFNSRDLGLNSCHVLVSEHSICKSPSLYDLEKNIRLLSIEATLSFFEKLCKFVKFIEYLKDNRIHFRFKDIICFPTSNSRFCSFDHLSFNKNDCSLGDKLFVIHPHCPSTVLDYFSEIGLCSSFSTQQYLNAINDYSQDSIDENLCKEIIAVLKFLYENFKQETSNLNQILIPSNNCVLSFSHKLCINDCPWLDSENPQNTCHDMIPPIVAHHFGVKTRRHFQLDAVGKPLGKSFGQRESLTNRLKRIASQYTDQNDLYKELLQNADDSGASFVHIVLDKTTYNNERVIAEGWEILSGPALLFYNNACFTETDLQGIQSLGEGSKQSDYNKIGKFGVGFNCVYQVTDTPEICTQLDNRGCGILGVLDPLFSIVRSTSPGVLIDLSSKFIEDFPDSFECFQLKTLPCLEGGTTFRLPFRKTASSLSENIPSLCMFEKNLRDFSETLSKTILFLRNVTSVRISVIENNVWHTVSEVCKTCSDEEVLFERPLQKTFNVKVEGHVNDRHFAEDWLISEKQDFFNNPNISFKRSLMRGSVALSLSKNISPTLFCYLPLNPRTDLFRGMSAPIIFNGDFILDESRKELFLDCASAFASWNSTILCDIIGHAYSNLFSDELIFNTWELCKGCIEDFFNRLFIFNNNSYDSRDVEYNINKGLFHYLQSNQVRFLPSIQNEQIIFCDLSNVVFCSFACSKKSEHSLMRKLCSNLDIVLVSMPLIFYKWMTNYNIQVESFSIEFLIRSLRNENVKNGTPIHQSVFCSRDVLLAFINFAKRNLTNTFFQEMKPLTIFLSEKEILYNYESRPLSNTNKICEIFPNLEMEFIDKEVEKRLIDFNLENLPLSKFCDLFEERFSTFSQNEIVKLSIDEFNAKLEWLKLIWKYLYGQKDCIENENRLQSLCLVPAKIHSVFALVSLNSASKIVVENNGIFRDIYYTIDLKDRKSIYRLYDIFEDKNYPFWYYNYIHDHQERAFLQSFSFQNLKVSFHTVLNFCIRLHRENDFFESEEIREYFLQYFINESSMMLFDDSQKAKLKLLPIHTSIDGKSVPFHVKHTYCWMSPIPRNGLFSNETVSILSCKPSNREFYKKLEPTILLETPTDFYTKVFIPVILDQLDIDDINCHLTFLQRLFSGKKKLSSDLRCLKSLLENSKVIEIKGKRFIPREVLYFEVSPHKDIGILNILVQWSSKELLQFSKFLGVRTVCSDEEVLRYANGFEKYCQNHTDFAVNNKKFFQHLIEKSNISYDTLTKLRHLRILLHQRDIFDLSPFKLVSVNDTHFLKSSLSIHVAAISELAARLGLNVMAFNEVSWFKHYKDRLISPLDLIKKFLNNTWFTQIPISISKSCFKTKSNFLSFVKFYVTVAEDCVHLALPIHLSAAGTIYSSRQNLFAGHDCLIELFPNLQDEVYDPDIEKILSPKDTFQLSDFVYAFQVQNPEFSRNCSVAIPTVSKINSLDWLEKIWDVLIHRFELENIVRNLATFSLIPSFKERDDLYFVTISISNFSVVTEKSFLNLDCRRLSSVYHLYDKFQSIEIVRVLKGLCLQMKTSNFSSFVKFFGLLLDSDEFNFSSFTIQRIRSFIFEKSASVEIFSSSITKVLLRLPIHRIITGQFTSIADKSIYLFFDDLPTKGFDRNAEAINSHNICYTTEEEKLFYLKIGAIEMEPEQVYIELIIPIYFKKLSQEDISVHLQFIYDKFYCKSDLDALSRKALFSALGKVPIIKKSDKTMAAICNLFDPNVDLFVVFRHSDLLPSALCKKNLLPFFRHLGLHSSIDDNLFLQLAHEYEMMRIIPGSCDHGVLFLSYASHHKEKIHASTLNEVFSLKIIKSFNYEKFGFVSIKESCKFKFFSILKYVKPILSAGNTELINNSHHLNNLCGKVQNADVVENIEKALIANDLKSVKDCLIHLQAHKFDNAVSRLNNICCIKSCYDTWIQPNQASRILPFNGFPYVCQVAEEFLQFWSIISFCGGTNQLDPNQAILALSLMKRDSINLEDPNNWLMVQTFLTFILRNHSEIKFYEINNINLITCDGKFRISRDCWVNDDDRFQTYNLLSDSVLIDFDLISMPNNRIISALKEFPRGFRPKFLSEDVVIVLSKKTHDNENICEENPEFSNLLNYLKCNDFKTYLIRLIQHYLFQQRQQYLSDAELTDTLEFLDLLKFISVHKIHLEVQSQFSAINGIKIPNTSLRTCGVTSADTVDIYYSKSCTNYHLYNRIFQMINIPELNQSVFEKLLQTTSNEERLNLMELYSISEINTKCSKSLLGTDVNIDIPMHLNVASRLDLERYVLYRDVNANYHYAILKKINDTSAPTNSFCIDIGMDSLKTVTGKEVFSIQTKPAKPTECNVFKLYDEQPDFHMVEAKILSSYKRLLNANVSPNVLSSVKKQILSTVMNEFDYEFSNQLMTKFAELDSLVSNEYRQGSESVSLSTSEQFYRVLQDPIVEQYIMQRYNENSESIDDFSYKLYRS